MRNQNKCPEGLTPIKRVTGIDISKEAIQLFIQLTSVAEKVHHPSISRSDIMDQLSGLDRELVNACNEKLLELNEQFTTIPITRA